MCLLFGLCEHHYISFYLLSEQVGADFSQWNFNQAKVQPKQVSDSVFKASAILLQNRSLGSIPVALNIRRDTMWTVFPCRDQIQPMRTSYLSLESS